MVFSHLISPMSSSQLTALTRDLFQELDVDEAIISTFTFEGMRSHRVCPNVENGHFDGGSPLAWKDCTIERNDFVKVFQERCVRATV